MSEHDMSGHCGAIIHVDGYTRNGNEVAAYDRQCGRDHNNENVGTGLIAPFKDFVRNFNDMNKTNVIGGDKYFHCKANYEAAARGLYGGMAAAILSLAKETKDIFKYGYKESVSDLKIDWRGLAGGIQRKNLLEVCGALKPKGLSEEY